VKLQDTYKKSVARLERAPSQRDSFCFLF